MASIDERVVAMSFENTKFEANVATTMGTLSKLDAAIANIGKTSGLQNIETQASKVTLAAPMSALDKLKAKLGMTVSGTTFTDMEASSNKVTLAGPMSALDKLQQKLGMVSAGTTFSNLEKESSKVSFSSLISAIDGISSHFNAMTVAAGVAFGNLTTTIATKAAGIGKSLTLDPAIGGLQEYATNLNSIQTILANTQASGANLDDVNSSLQDLNKYSDQTIYNFSEMAKNIGTFTAAGVDLDKSTQSIKGIANLAALSGSNSQQASTAMYQLSQAIASGKVSLQDWNSVVNAGMGGTTFQRALATTAQQMGTLSDGAVKLKGKMKNVSIEGQSFRDSIAAKPGEKSWLTSDVLVKTLEQFTGDLTDADLAAQGFNEDQIKAIQQTAKTAKAAATEVKTLPQVFDVAKETIGSGWAQTFQTIFGNFEEAKKTFTDLSNVINGFINQNAAARNKVLADWKALGGRKELIEGIKSAFEGIMSVLKPIKDAFRDIFPAKTGQDLFELTKKFKEFADNLKIGPETAENLRRTFKGFFAVLDIGKGIIGGIIGVFADLLGVVGKGSGGFLSFTGSIGDFLVAIDDALVKGGGLESFFDGLSAVLKVPLDLLKNFASILGGLFDGADKSKGDKVAGSVKNVGDALKPLGPILDTVSDAWERFLGFVDDVKNAVSPLLQQIADIFSNLGHAVADAIRNVDMGDALDALQTTILGGILLALKKGLTGGGKIDFGGGFFKNINEVLEGLTGNLKAMEQNVKAKTLLAIAAAIGVLAAAIFVLSQIDPKKLNQAMTAVAVGMGELVGAMALLDKAVKGPAFLKMPFIAVSLVLLSGALVILAGAMKIFATMSWEDLAKGLVGVGGALVVVAGATQLIDGPKIMLAGLAMIPLAVGINLLATAVKLFATLSWKDMAKGLVGLAVALGAVAMGVSLMPPTLPLIGAGLIGVGLGVNMLAGAVASFAAIDPVKMTAGILGMAAALVAIGLAIETIPPTIALQAAGLILVAGALTGISAVIGILGNMDIATLVKGIVAMGGALVVLGLGLTAMEGALPGSVALLAAAAALAVLAPTLAFLGTLKWGTIFKGLAAVALTLGTLAVVGALAAVPLAALGAGMLLLGVGLTAVAGAVYLAAKGIALLGAEGLKGMAALTAAIGAFILIFPKMVIDFVKGIVVILAEVVKLAPAIVSGLVTIVTTLLDAVIALAPKLAEAVSALVTTILAILTENAPKYFAAGFELFQDFLRGIRDNMPAIVQLVADIVVNLLNGLATALPRIQAAGLNVLLKFIFGIESNMEKIVTTVSKLLTKFLDAISARIPDITRAGVNLIARFINSLAGNIGKIVEAGTNLIIKFMDGIQQGIPRVIKKGTEVARTFLNGLADGLVKLADIGFNAVIRFLNGIADTIRKNSTPLIDAGANILDALVDGMIEAAGRMAGPLRKAIDALFGALPGWAKKILGIHSPSSVFMEIGKQVIEGMRKGVEDNKPQVHKAAESTAQELIDKIKAVLGIHSPSTVMEDIGKDVGRGFAKGLHGSADDIHGAFRDLNDKLTEAMRTAQQNIAEAQATLDEERAKRKPDTAAIAAAQKTIDENTQILRASSAAHVELTKNLDGEEKQLVRLTKRYEDTSKKLEDAQKALDDAKAKRDEAQRSLTDKFATTPAIDEKSKTAVTDYTAALQEQINATKSYTDTLAKLRAAGLDDTTYRKLLDEGLAGKEFAEQLLAGGKPAIESINKMDAELMAAATTLAQNAATGLYQAGVDAAQGLVDGLKSKQKDLAASMDSLADMIVRSIKRKLKIKSPSQVMTDVGIQTMKGFAVGIEKATPEVTDSMENAANEVKNTAQALFMRLPDFQFQDPVITPVLDLTKLEKQKDLVGGMFTNVIPIKAAVSARQAATISAATPAETAADGKAAVSQKFEFNQYNTSPESLTEIEIYRQTNNQLAQLKSVVGLKQ